MSNEEDFFNSAMEMGAEDCFFEDDNYEGVCSPKKLSIFYNELEKKFGEPEASGFHWKPVTLINIEGDKLKSLFNLLDELENDEDVQHVFSNFEASDEELGRLL